MTRNITTRTIPLSGSSQLVAQVIKVHAHQTENSVTAASSRSAVISTDIALLVIAISG